MQKCHQIYNTCMNCEEKVKFKKNLKLQGIAKMRRLGKSRKKNAPEKKNCAEKNQQNAQKMKTMRKIAHFWKNSTVHNDAQKYEKIPPANPL